MFVPLYEYDRKPFFFFINKFASKVEEVLRSNPGLPEVYNVTEFVVVSLISTTAFKLPESEVITNVKFQKLVHHQSTSTIKTDLRRGLSL